jgi:hypothetical protein
MMRIRALPGGPVAVPPEILAAGLSPAAIVIWIVLRDGRSLAPHREELAEQLGSSLSSIKRALKELKDADYLEIIQLGRGHTEWVVGTPPAVLAARARRKPAELPKMAVEFSHFAARFAANPAAYAHEVLKSLKGGHELTKTHYGEFLDELERLGFEFREDGRAVPPPGVPLPRWWPHRPPVAARERAKKAKTTRSLAGQS